MGADMGDVGGGAQQHTLKPRYYSSEARKGSVSERSYHNSCLFLLADKSGFADGTSPTLQSLCSSLHPTPWFLPYPDRQPCGIESVQWSGAHEESLVLSSKAWLPFSFQTPYPHPPTPCFSLPLSPMGSSQRFPMSAPYEHQGPSFFFLCFLNLSSGLFATTQWKKHVCNQTTAQLQITTNNINILLFPPPKNKEGFPPSGATSRWVTPLRRSRVPSSNTVLMRPSPHPPTHTFVWQLLSFNFSSLFKKKPPTVRKKTCNVSGIELSNSLIWGKRKPKKQKRWPRFALLSNCVTGAVRNINNEQNKFRKEEGGKTSTRFLRPDV